MHSNEHKSPRGNIKTAKDNEIRAFLVKEVKKLPHGLELNDDEREVWKELLKARKYDEWRDCDLQQLHQIVKLEMRARHAWKQIESLGEIILNDKGAPIENPWLDVYRKYVQLKHKLMAALALNIAGDYAYKINEKSIAQNKMEYEEAPPLLAVN